MSSAKQSRTAREYFEAGVASSQWSKPFDLDVTPSSPAAVEPDPAGEREAAEVRRRIAGELREAQDYLAELDAVSRERDAERRRLATSCTSAWADEVAPEAAAHEHDSQQTATSRHPTSWARPVDPASPEALAAREATMDRILARNWPGGSR